MKKQKIFFILFQRERERKNWLSVVTSLEIASLILKKKKELNDCNNKKIKKYGNLIFSISQLSPDFFFLFIIFFLVVVVVVVVEKFLLFNL